MGFFNKLKEGAGKAADLAKQTVEVTRLNTQISSKKREIEKNHSRIGKKTAYAGKQLPLMRNFVQAVVINS
jgi:hypothetical protein